MSCPLHQSEPALGKGNNLSHGHLAALCLLLCLPLQVWNSQFVTLGPGLLKDDQGIILGDSKVVQGNTELNEWFPGSQELEYSVQAQVAWGTLHKV